jgi:hypothetical protein
MGNLDYVDEITMIIKDCRDNVFNELTNWGLQGINMSDDERCILATRMSIKYILRCVIDKALSDDTSFKVENTFVQKFLREADEFTLDRKTDLIIKDHLKQLSSALDEFQPASVLHYVIGGLYESSQNKMIRKALGQYFTEKKYVDLILDRIPLNAESTILEPAVGGGSFLIEAYDRIAGQVDEQDLSKVLRDNLYGFDIDMFCVEFTTFNLLFRHRYLLECSLNIVNEDFLNCDIMKRFDVIVGNPPYNARLDDKTKRKMKRLYPEICSSDGSPGNLNSATLFLRRSLDLLKEGGWLGFVMPNSILRVDSYKKLRQYVLKSGTVKSIINIGRAFKDAGLEMMIIVIQKQKQNTETVEIISDISKKPFLMDYTFLSRWDVFPIYLTNRLAKIAETIEKDTVPLDSICVMPRGYSISSKSDIFTLNPFCSSDEYLPVLRGQDIGRYRVKNPQLYLHKSDFENLGTDSQGCDSKILIQNVAKRIVAAYDANGHFVLDTLNTLILRNEYIDSSDYMYLLAILNSELMDFYFQNTINNRSKLTIHMDRPYLGRIPVKVLSNQEALASKARRISALNDLLMDYEPVNLIRQNEFTTEYELKNLIKTFQIKRRQIQEQIKEEEKSLNDIVYELYEVSRYSIQISRNTGTNPVREYSFLTQLKSFVRKHRIHVEQKKLGILQRVL